MPRRKQVDAWQRWTTDASGIGRLTLIDSEDLTTPENRKIKDDLDKRLKEIKQKARREAGLEDDGTPSG